MRILTKNSKFINSVLTFYRKPEKEFCLRNDVVKLAKRVTW